MAFAPFIKKKTPSFFVNPDRQLWRCFGACQTGGDVLAFLMKYENITFFEALKELAQETGVKLEHSAIEDRAWQQKEKLVNIHAIATKYYHYLLMEHSLGKAARDYLDERGINEKVRETFQLGYAPASWDSLGAYLQKKGFNYEDMLTAGLVIKSTKGSYYDRFRNRLMFPIIDARDYVIAFSGRTLNKDTKEAKYINSPETPLYHKRETLYGLHVAKDAIRSEKKAMIVEGEFDMISSFMHGITNTVAVKGSIVTIDQIKLLKKYTDHLILALDSDFSGTETTLRAIKDGEEMDMRIDIITFSFGKDPDEALKNDAITFKKLLKSPISLYDFVINTVVQRHNIEDPFEKKKLAEEVMPFLSTIENPIIKAHYIKKLAQILSTDEKAIEMTLRDHLFKQKKKTRRVLQRTVPEKDKYESLQKTLLACIVQNDAPQELYKKAAAIIDDSDFTIPSYKELFTIIGLMPHSEGEDFVKELVKKLPPPLFRRFLILFF
ncbi:MAG: DNA primase [Microgenomates bacterium OLB23]|nr:MAG: DNA primase [Microgenomates bacterium OLB23]